MPSTTIEGTRARRIVTTTTRTNRIKTWGSGWPGDVEQVSKPAARIPSRDRRERANPLPGCGPDARRLASNTNRSWSWARLAARAALFEGLSACEKRELIEELFPEVPGVAVHRVADPGAYGLVDGFFSYEASVIIRVELAEVAPEADDVWAEEAHVGGEEAEAEEGEAVPAPIDAAFSGMEGQSIAIEEMLDLGVHFLQLEFAV